MPWVAASLEEILERELELPRQRVRRGGDCAEVGSPQRRVGNAKAGRIRNVEALRAELETPRTNGIVLEDGEVEPPLWWPIEDVPAGVPGGVERLGREATGVEPLRHARVAELARADAIRTIAIGADAGVAARRRIHHGEREAALPERDRIDLPVREKRPRQSRAQPPQRQLIARGDHEPVPDVVLARPALEGLDLEWQHAVRLRGASTSGLGHIRDATRPCVVAVDGEALSPPTVECQL